MIMDPEEKFRKENDVYPISCQMKHGVCSRYSFRP